MLPDAEFRKSNNFCINCQLYAVLCAIVRAAEQSVFQIVRYFGSEAWCRCDGWKRGARQAADDADERKEKDEDAGGHLSVGQ